MGTSDCTTVLGNRDGAQQGLNFDELDNSEKNPNEIPNILPEAEVDEFDSSCSSSSSSSIEKEEEPTRFPAFSANDVNSKISNLENAQLIFEVFLVNGKNPIFGENEPFVGRTPNLLDEWFTRTIFPLVVDVKLYSGSADCDEWSFSGHLPISTSHYFLGKCKSDKRLDLIPTEKVQALPGEFEYFEYSDKGTFKFVESSSYNEENNELTSEMFFPSINKEKQEV